MVKPMIHYGEDGARATILASGWIDATYLIEAVNEVFSVRMNPANGA